jgi:hypothetical protein
MKSSVALKWKYSTVKTNINMFNTCTHAGYNVVIDEIIDQMGALFTSPEEKIFDQND